MREFETLIYSPPGDPRNFRVMNYLRWLGGLLAYDLGGNQRLYKMAEFFAINSVLYEAEVQDRMQALIDQARAGASANYTTCLTGNITWTGLPANVWRADTAHSLAAVFVNGVGEYDGALQLVLCQAADYPAAAAYLTGVADRFNQAFYHSNPVRRTKKFS